MDERRRFGNQGEHLAAVYLKQKGFEILESQYRCKYGEIDLVAKEQEEIVFIEVKSRQSDARGYPEESVTPEKVRHLIACAEFFLDEHQLTDRLWRIDVVAIEMKDITPMITHLVAIDIDGGS